MARIKNNEVRQDILRIACDKFMKKGFANVTMKEIANDVGIYPSLLQHYFSTKDDMLIHIGFSMTKAVFDYLYQTQYDDMVAYGDDAVALNEVLFKKYFYSCMSRNNNQLLKLYINVLNNAKLIKAGIDYMESNTEDCFVPVDSDVLRGKRQDLDYVITGLMSQFVILYLEKSSFPPLSEYVNRAIDHGLYAIGVSESRRKEIIQYADSMITPEREEECYALMMKYLQEFADCEW